MYNYIFSNNNKFQYKKINRLDMNKSIKKLIVTNIIKSQVENMINYIYYKYKKIIDNKTRLKLIEIYTNQFIVNDKLNEKEKGS